MQVNKIDSKKNYLSHASCNYRFMLRLIVAEIVGNYRLIYTCASLAFVAFGSRRIC